MNPPEPRPRRFQRLVLGAGMAVALFILERRVVKAMRTRGESKSKPRATRGINVDGSNLGQPKR